MAASAICFFKLFLMSLKQVRKSVGPLRKFENDSPRTFKFFVRLHYDDVRIIIDQAQPFVFHQKEDSFQYYASLAITGPIRGTSSEKICQEIIQKALMLC